MKYIIEDATTNFYGQEETNSFLIEGSKVQYKSNHFAQYNHMRLNTDQFIVTPGHIMIDFSVVYISDFILFKERMKYLQSIGCTTFITATEVESENDLYKNLKKSKHALINSSIDHLVGVKVPLTKLTRTFVRKCCKYKVPIIFTEINNLSDLYSVAWQTIREELFPYRIFIIPIWNIETPKWNLKRLKSEWVETLTTNKILTERSVPNEHHPLTKRFLLNVGLFPKKGSLQMNCDADYLLFDKGNLLKHDIEIQELQPDIVFSNGIVKKAGDQIFMRPGIGKELTVNTPNKFVPISHAFQRETIIIDYY